VTGQPTPILEGVGASPGVGGAQFSFSRMEASRMSQVAAEVQNVSIYWMIVQANLRPSARLPAATAVRILSEGSVWLWNQ